MSRMVSNPPLPPKPIAPIHSAPVTKPREVESPVQLGGEDERDVDDVRWSTMPCTD